MIRRILDMVQILRERVEEVFSLIEAEVVAVVAAAAIIVAEDTEEKIEKISETIRTTVIIKTAKGAIMVAIKINGITKIILERIILEAILLLEGTPLKIVHVD